MSTTNGQPKKQQKERHKKGQFRKADVHLSIENIAAFGTPTTVGLPEVDLTAGSQTTSESLLSKSATDVAGCSSSARTDALELMDTKPCESWKLGYSRDSESDTSQEILPPKLTSSHRGRS